MVQKRSDAVGEPTTGLSRAQTLDLCARFASYSEADAAPKDLLARAGIEAVQRFPEDAEVLTAVGRMFLAGEDLHDAERVLRRAVRFAPQDPHALRCLGEVLLRSGDPAAAHAALSSAVACGMNDPWTKQWVARALDYSELIEDLGREGIARDVRLVLGKPGQGPPEDERRKSPSASPPARAHGRKGSLGRIDKGVFFAGDARAEPPEVGSRRFPGNEIVDLPTPIPAEPTATKRDGEGAKAPGGSRKSTPGAAAPAKARAATKDSSPDITIEAVLADDAAWGASRSDAPKSAPQSEPIPPSDTEISAWVPDMELLARDRRSAPVEMRASSSPPAPPREPAKPSLPAADRTSASPPKITTAAPERQRLAAADLYDEFTEHKRPFKSVQSAVEQALAQKAAAEKALADRGAGDRARLGREVGDRARADAESMARADADRARLEAEEARAEREAAARARLEAERLRAEAQQDRAEAEQARAEATRARAEAEAAKKAAEERSRRRGPPPLPGERLLSPVESPTLTTGKGGVLPDLWKTATGEGPAISVLDHDASGPVTAPPSALIPLDNGPVTAPPSALIPLDPEGSAEALREPGPASSPLPPEPPSLQVPSKALLGGGLRPPTPRAAPAATDAEGARASAAPSAPVAPPAPKPRSRVQLILIRAAIAILVAGVVLGAFQLYKRNRTTKMRVFTAQAAIALHTGGPRGIADAEAAIASAKKLDPKSRAVALGLVRVKAFAVLDVDAARVTELASAMKTASDLGASSSDLAFAEIISRLAAGDTASALELITHNDEDPERASDAVYQVAAGAALEPTEPAAAIERYRAALKIDDDYLTVGIRLVRALAFAERGAEANDRLQAMMQKWPGKLEISALAAVAASADPERASQATIDPGTDIDMLPRPLRAVARLLVKGADEGALVKATAEADTAPILVLCGEAALRLGNEATARDAAQHALDLAPSHAPAYALIARTALASARFEEARQAALRASPEVGAEVLSFLAYESSDLEAMRTAAGRRVDEPHTETVSAGFARLRGAEPLAVTTIEALAKSGRFWADIVAIDAALDAGEIKLAQTIANGWQGGEKHPVRAARLARLYRYQGKNGLAQSTSTSAAPTIAARVESALASAEMSSARDAAAQSLAGGRSPEERWSLVFLLAREGRAEAAHAAMNSVAIPPAEAPLVTRRIAALAMNELHIAPSPIQPMWASFDVWRRNPDVARALGIELPKDEAAEPAAPPEKPVLKGKIPRKGDEDPY